MSFSCFVLVLSWACLSFVLVLNQSCPLFPWCCYFLGLCLVSTHLTILVSSLFALCLTLGQYLSFYSQSSSGLVSVSLLFHSGLHLVTGSCSSFLLLISLSFSSLSCLRLIRICLVKSYKNASTVSQ